MHRRPERVDHASFDEDLDSRSIVLVGPKDPCLLGLTTSIVREGGGCARRLRYHVSTGFAKDAPVPRLTFSNNCFNNLASGAGYGDASLVHRVRAQLRAGHGSSLQTLVP
jgi:hypothetical protein